MIYSIECSEGEPALDVVLVNGSYLGRWGCGVGLGVPSAVPVTVSATATTSPEAAFSDGLVLGWGVVAAMVAAYAVTMLRRAL